MGVLQFKSSYGHDSVIQNKTLAQHYWRIVVLLFKICHSTSHARVSLNPVTSINMNHGDTYMLVFP